MKHRVPSLFLALVALVSPSRTAFAGDADPWQARYDGGLLPAFASVWRDVTGTGTGQQRHMLARDSSGAFYVGATVTMPYGGYGGVRAAVAKLSGDGGLLWTRLLPSYSVPDSIALDGTGSVRVLAVGDGVLMVVAYDPDGVLLWQREAPLSWDGRMAVDAWGNTLLAYAGSPNEEAILAKLDPQGSLLWSRRLEPGIRDVTVDAAGDVFAESWSSVVKYTGSGAQVWSSPVAPSWSSQLEPSAGGSVYRGVFTEGGGAAVTRFGASGEPAWTASLPDAVHWADMALAATPSGGVVVSTGSGGAFSTRALSSDGSTLWESTLSPPTTQAVWGYVRGLEVDPAGHAYVAVTSWDVASGCQGGMGPHGWVVSYDGEGKEVWLVDVPGAVAATTAPPRGGRLAVAGQRCDSTTMALWDYDAASGTEVMATQAVLMAPASDLPRAGLDPRFDVPEHSLSSDVAGNVFVVGRSSGADTHLGVALKYDDRGAQQWARAGSVPLSGALADGTGGVVVGGTEKRGSDVGYLPAEAGSIYLARYDPAGALVWETRYPPRESRNDRAHLRAMAADAGRNVYVTGLVEQRRPPYVHVQEVLLKFDPSGGLLWARTRALPYGLQPAVALDVDGAGTARVAGGESVRVYDSNGNLQWAAAWPTCSGAVAVAHDGQGATYAVKYLEPSVQGDIVTVKLDGSGQVVWQASYDGPAHGKDRGMALQVSADGQVWVAGISESGSEATDYVTLKYSQAGTLAWEARYDGGLRDEARALVVDPNGNAYVTGSSPSGPDQWSLRPAWATLKYDSSGTVQWVERGMEGTGVYGAEAIALTSSGQVVVAGQATFPDTGLDIVTIGYSQDGLAQEPDSRPGPIVEPGVEDRLTTFRSDEKRPPRKRLAGLYDRTPVETPEE